MEITFQFQFPRGNLIKATVAVAASRFWLVRNWQGTTVQTEFVVSDWISGETLKCTETRTLCSISLKGVPTWNCMCQYVCVYVIFIICDKRASYNAIKSGQNHSPRGSGSRVLTATGLVNEDWWFSTHHRIHWSLKICRRWLRPWPAPLCKIQCKSVHGGLWEVKYNHFLARNVYISRLCYDVSVRLSVRLSVTEVHWRIIANLGFKFRSKFTAHCGRGEG